MVDLLGRSKADGSTVPGLLSVLVASGADINAKNSEGKTPLFLAVSCGSPIVVRQLLEQGANSEEPTLTSYGH